MWTDEQRTPRIVHTMLRVGDLERSLAFYTGALGMTLFRREDYPADRFTLAFVGYGSEVASQAIELTYNWDQSGYELGSGFGHVALAVGDVYATCLELAAKGIEVVRPAGPMSSVSPDRNNVEVIAFVEDPDGYRIELIQVA